jgi:hypothetical protein
MRIRSTSVESVYNPVDEVEHALSNGAASALMQASPRQLLIGLSCEAAKKLQMLFYVDAALRKAFNEG